MLQKNPNELFLATAYFMSGLVVHSAQLPTSPGRSRENLHAVTLSAFPRALQLVQS